MESAELSIVFEDYSDKTPRDKAKRCYSKHKIYREFVLASLAAEVEKRSPSDEDKQNESQGRVHGPTCQIDALDAISATGVAGLQWKKTLGGKARVTLADHDGVSKLKRNAHLNDLETSEYVLDPTRIPSTPREKQREKEICVCHAEAKTVLSLESFDFVYLVPFKSYSSYFEPVFSHIHPFGLLCCVIPDVSSFARTPHVVQRWYGASVAKTEYLKEMAARTIIACMARSAVKFNKGIKTEYVVSHEDSLLICIRVVRGQGAADSAIQDIASLLHCRFCEERVFLPNQLAPLEDPYRLLPCSCKSSHPGKTAIVLGPMWKGSIFNPAFIRRLQGQGKILQLSSRFTELIRLMLSESLCSEHFKVCVSTTTKNNETKATLSELDGDQNRKRSGDAMCVDSSFKDSSAEYKLGKKSQPETEAIAYSAQPIISTCNEPASCKSAISTSRSPLMKTRDSFSEKAPVGIGPISVDENTTDSRKRKSDTEGLDGSRNGDFSSSHGLKKRRPEELEDILSPGESSNVLFYFSVRKLKSTSIPKLDKLVALLQEAGHKASRTHFDSTCVRTSATAEQFLGIVA